MGLDNLIKAIYFANKQDNKLHLTIGGDGPEKEYLKNFAKDLGITKQITFTGFIPFEELPKYYGAADFFVMPTRNLEGFGLATVESLACGTPVIAFNCPGCVKEIFDDPHQGTLVPVGDVAAMVRTISERLENMRNDPPNSLLSNRFQIESIIAQYQDVLGG